MSEIDQQPTTQPEKKKRTRILIIILILLILGAGIGVAIYMFNQDSWYDTNSKSGSYEGKTQEEIQADLNRIVEEGMMNISIAATVYFEDGASYGDARIENIAANNKDQKVVITLDDTDEVIYESGAIAPGEYIQSIKLAQDLEPGTYAATATFTGYDTENHTEQGKAAAQIKIVVQN